MASERQLEYAESPLIDCGFTTRIQRNAYISRLLRKRVKFLDSLTSTEMSVVLTDLEKIAEGVAESKEEKEDEGVSW